MLRCTLAPEPTDFDQFARQKGNEWLKLNPGKIPKDPTVVIALLQRLLGRQDYGVAVRIRCPNDSSPRIPVEAARPRFPSQ
jgi:hypothetical protein